MKISDIQKHNKFRRLLTFFAVLLSSVLQIYALQVFVMPAGLLSGGFTGIALLVDRMASLAGFTVSTSAAMICLNLPVAFICSRDISIKFTIFSMLQVFLTSIGLKLFQFTPLFDDVVLNVIFGGVFYGISVVVALRGNASTGGTDFIALYVSNKRGKSIWEYVFAGNVALLVIFGYLFGWEYAGYSIIFQYISTRMISAFHHRYERVTMQVTTRLAPQVIEAFIKEFKHGISCVEAVGGYSKKKMYLLHTVVSSYEVNDIVHLMNHVDEKIIINTFRTEEFYGNFYRPPMK